MLNKVVIPVAGKGTRLYPLTKITPKYMLPLGNKRVIDYILDEVLLVEELTDIILVVSSNKTVIENYMVTNYGGLNITYVVQENQDGLASAIYCAKDFVGNNSFVLMLGDCIVVSNNEVSPLERIIESFNKLNSSATILVQELPKEELSRCGIVKPILMETMDMEFEIEDIVEKPQIEKCPSKYSIAGRY